MSYFPGYDDPANTHGENTGQYAAPPRSLSRDQQYMAPPVNAASNHGVGGQHLQMNMAGSRDAYFQGQNAWPQANQQYYTQQNQQHGVAYMPSHAQSLAQTSFPAPIEQNIYQYQNSNNVLPPQGQPQYDSTQQFYMPGNHAQPTRHQIPQDMEYSPQHGAFVALQQANASYDNQAQVAWQNGQLDGAGSSQQLARRDSYQNSSAPHQAHAVHQSPTQNTAFRSPQQRQISQSQPQRSINESSPQQNAHRNVQQQQSNRQVHNSSHHARTHHLSPEQFKRVSINQHQGQDNKVRDKQMPSFAHQSSTRSPSQSNSHHDQQYVQNFAPNQLSYQSQQNPASDPSFRRHSSQSQHKSNMQAKQSPMLNAMNTSNGEQSHSFTPLTTISPAQLHPNGLASVQRKPSSSNVVRTTTSHAQLQQLEHSSQRQVHCSSNTNGRHDDRSDSVKRRKSNDGSATSIRPTILQPQSVNKQNGINKVQSSASSLVKESQSSQSTSRSDVDLKRVMYALADEYLNVARKLKRSQLKDESTQDYERLMSTALGCLESILQNFRFTEAREEAQLRLRLATLIFEETTNLEKAEEVLIKGYTLCDQANLPNCKYAMQHLLIRISHSRHPRAAKKSIDKIITEVEKLRLTAWTYTFRLLGATCAIDSSDFSTAIRHVNAVAQKAEHKSHNAVRMLALCLESAVHFMNGADDSYELAQHTIASIQSLQLDPSLQAIPQLRAMAGSFTSSSSIMAFSVDAMSAAMQQMQRENESVSKIKSWNDDGSFLLPLGKKAIPDVEADTGGLVTSDSKGELSLRTFWLNKNDLWTISYIISAIACLPKNGEQRTAEVFLGEAAKINQTRINVIGGHGLGATHTAQRVQILQLNLTIMLASVLAGRAQYGLALEQLRSLKENVNTFQFPQSQRSRIRLIRAMCEQGLGHLQESYKLYLPEINRTDIDTLPVELKDIRTLAVLSSIHVWRRLNSDTTGEEDKLLESIEDYCLTHPNKSFASTYYIIKATTAPKDTLVIKTKESINNAMSPAQSAKNRQLLSIIMNTMTQLFFTDIVGKQAGNASNAARTLAGQSGDFLWVAIACGMLRNTCELSGAFQEAAGANQKAIAAIEQIPPDVRNELRLGMANS